MNFTVGQYLEFFIQGQKCFIRVDDVISQNTIYGLFVEKVILRDKEYGGGLILEMTFGPNFVEMGGRKYEMSFQTIS